MIKKIFVLLLLLIQPVCFAYTESILNDIEMSQYGTSYQNEDLASRLRRLETDVFGMSQSGNVESRINNLAQMASSVGYTYGIQPYENYYYPQKKGVVKRFFDNVSSTFTSPSMTGYTPSFYGSNIYPNNMYRRELMNYPYNSNYCPFNNGYYPNNHQKFHNHNYNNYNKNNNLSRFPSKNRLSSRYKYNNGFNPYSSYPYRIPTDSLTNVATRSTVHILRD